MKTILRSLGALAALACLLTPLQAQSAKPDTRVSLRVEGRSLTDVVQYLRQESGYNIVVVDAGDTPITIDVTDVGWRDALELAAEMAGCVVEERTAGVLAVARPPRVDFSFDGAQLTAIIDTIAKLSGANIVVAPEVTGTLSLRLKDVPWREALDVAVKTLGYVVVEEERGILRVVDPVSLQAQMESHSYQLRYVRPAGNYVPLITSEFLARTSQIQQQQQGGGQNQDPALRFPLIGALRKALSPGGDLDYVEARNVIIVRDTPQVHQEIQDMLDRFDVEPAQVFCDVKFVSTTTSDLFSLGVDYGDNGPSASISGGQIPVTLPFNLGNGGFEDLVIANPGEIGPFADAGLNFGDTIVPSTIFGALSFTNLAATLRLLQSDSTTEIIQAPKIIALDGHEATIFVGETIRYAEAKSEQGQAGGLQLSVAEASSSPVEVGFQLLIRPNVIPGTNQIAMDVIPKETSLSGTGDPAIAPPGFDVFTVGASGLEGSIALPRKRSSTIVTSMLLESGETAVIGGLTTDQVINRESGVPGLRKIPLLGWLFEFEEESLDRRTLMVFVTPSVVRSTADNERILRQELELRREEYGDRIENLLFGEAGLQAPINRPVQSAQLGNDSASGIDYQYSTFVQAPQAGERPPAEDSAETSEE